MVSAGFYEELSTIFIYVLQYWDMILPIFVVISIWSLVRIIRALII